jgi:hypothetical protein
MTLAELEQHDLHVATCVRAALCRCAEVFFEKNRESPGVPRDACIRAYDVGRILVFGANDYRLMTIMLWDKRLGGYRPWEKDGLPVIMQPNPAAVSGIRIINDSPDART